MNLAEILGIAVGLSMDTFAIGVATSISLGGVSKRQVFRFAFHFGLFQAVMPVIGWFCGANVAQYIQSWDHWIAFTLLAFVGGKAVIEAWRGENEDSAAPKSDPTRGWSLIGLSVATSIDALAVGLSFAMLDVVIWRPCLIIGAVTGSLTTVGMVAGGRLGSRFGKRVETLGGLILIGIGAKILFEHLVG